MVHVASSAPVRPLLRLKIRPPAVRRFMARSPSLVCASSTNLLSTWARGRQGSQEPLPRPFCGGEPLRAGHGLEAPEFTRLKEDGQARWVLELRRTPHPCCHGLDVYTFLRQKVNCVDAQR